MKGLPQTVFTDRDRACHSSLNTNLLPPPTNRKELHLRPGEVGAIFISTQSSRRDSDSRRIKKHEGLNGRNWVISITPLREIASPSPQHNLHVEVLQTTFSLELLTGIENRSRLLPVYFHGNLYVFMWCSKFQTVDEIN